jgi:hypothetical protein
MTGMRSMQQMPAINKKKQRFNTMNKRTMAEDFIQPEGTIGSFGVVKLWPGVKVAEDEVIARLKIAANLLGLTCVEISPEGLRIEEPGLKVSRDDLDFVIHLHYETPKSYDIFSFVALWNPVQFYFNYVEGGYRRFTNNLLSHDDFLSCDSPGADDHIRRLIVHDPCRLPPRFTLFHSVAEPILEPALGDLKLFYAGINWDRLIGEHKSRHQDLLKALDNADIIRIYGPRLLLGMNVWEGYKCYAGEIPFDGISVIHEIANAGIGLVLSSEAHKDSGLMSSRLFECLAAGVVIICDENPFARRHFGGALLYIDTTGDVDDTYQQICQHLCWIKEHRTEALKLARQAQIIFREKFTLDKSLANIYLNLASRKAEVMEPYKTTVTPLVTLFMLLPNYNNELLQQHIDSAIGQTYSMIKFVLIVDQHELKKYNGLIQEKLNNHNVAFDVRGVEFFQDRSLGGRGKKNPVGRILYDQLESIEVGDYFIVVGENESLFTEHVQALVKAITTTGDGAAYARTILKIKTPSTTTYEVQSEVEIFDYNPLYPLGLGRFLIQKPENYTAFASTLPYLDEKVPALFIAQIKCVPSGKATLIKTIESLEYDEETTKKMRIEDETLCDFLPLTVIERHVPGPFIKGKDNKIEIGSVKQLSEHQRRIIVYDLFLAIPMPIFIRKTLLWCYHKMNKFT